jgi:TolB-like protein
VPATVTDRLDSWKEIARYLNRSVRTVRRWECQEGLPVHRHAHRALASVYALKSEVAAWRESHALRSTARAPVADTAAGSVLSIAVLPFINLSVDPENAYFADGLTEEVTTILSRVHALHVTSRTSCATFRGTKKGAKAIAMQLGVRFLLEGSVRRDVGRLRVSAQLIDAAKDIHLWADAYDGTIDEIFAIQERIARTIVDSLRLRLSAYEEKQLGERPMTNVAAYECYLRARYDSWRWRQDSIERAVQLLQEALSMIGANVRLYAALGLAHLQYREAGIDLSERPLLEAESCASKLFALNGCSAAGLQLRGWIRYSRGLIQEAVHDLKSALEIEPNNADTLLLLSNCYLISGHVPSARPLLERLTAVDPMTPVTRCMPGFADIMEGRFEQAIEPYRQMYEMDRANPMAHLFYVWVLILNRRIDEAATIGHGLPAELRDSVPGRVSSFLNLAAAGKPISAQAELTHAIDTTAKATDLFPRLLAQGFALAGLPEEALHWLEVAIDKGFINYPFLALHDASFARLRSDARFNDLLEMVRDRWMRFEA